MTSVVILISSCKREPPRETDAQDDEHDGEHDDGDEPETGSEPEPEPEPEPDPNHAARQLALGSEFSCVLQQDGGVVCWGKNQYGLLGQAHVQNLGDDELPSAAGPIDIGGPAVAISAGHDHACAVRTDGEVVCWGNNWFGPLGYGNLDTIGDNERPVEAGTVDIGAKVRSVHAGVNNTCAITVDEQLHCWGNNGGGSLGQGHQLDIGDDEAPSAAGPVDVGGPVIDVALAGSNVCAVLDSGDVRCWGPSGDLLARSVGEAIGDDEVPNDFPPIDLGGPALAIAGGGDHFCALLEFGDVVCWGRGAEGQLGRGDAIAVGELQTPAEAGPVAIGERVVSITAGGHHSCAVTESGSAYCWGQPLFDEPLGYPDVEGAIGGELRPEEVGPIALPGPVDEIAAGQRHTCARIGDDVYCWGAGEHGALGDGRSEDIGDDEPAASAGPVQFGGGSGNGGVEPGPPEFDGEVDAVLHISTLTRPPAELAVYEIIDARGSYRDCEGCTDSTVIRTADGETLIAADISETDRMHPGEDVADLLGIEPEDFLAPLELEAVDLGVCPELEGFVEGDGCVGSRLTLDVSYPNAQLARLLDNTRGQVGGGYVISVHRLQDWAGPCFEEESSRRSLTVVRQDCAPDCGPIDVIESCEPEPLAAYDTLWLRWFEAPPAVGYQAKCRILAHTMSFDEVHMHLDCIHVL